MYRRYGLGHIPVEIFFTPLNAYPEVEDVDYVDISDEQESQKQISDIAEEEVEVEELN